MKTIALAGYKIAALGVLLTLIHESKIIYSKFSLSSKSCYPLPFLGVKVQTVTLNSAGWRNESWRGIGSNFRVQA